MQALDVYLGREAAARVSRDGWNPELFTTLVGASGGPKWFVLGHLDRLLFGDFLQRSAQPLNVIGSSIGTWRHACLTTDDPVAAIQRLEDGYLLQRYAQKPTPNEVSEVSRGILNSVLGDTGASALIEHPRITTYIITARGRGFCGSSHRAMLASGMTAAATGNAVHRRLLQWHFQRVAFRGGAHSDVSPHFQDFGTQFCPLQQSTVVPALHASGAIPFVLEGERNIAGAPAGQYWDGGILDYHFDLNQIHSTGLILYPHFNNQVITGWFDKFLPWRKTSLSGMDKLALLCPSAAFIADLPRAKIPDRNDFTRLEEHERIAYWQECVERSRALAEEFAELITGTDPLRGVTLLPSK